MNDEERIFDLSRILKSYASNATERAVVINSMDANKDITPKDYVIALADGLKYGNWPWITHSKPKSFDELNLLSPAKFPSQNEFIKNWTDKSVIWCEKCYSFECSHVKSLENKK